MAVELATRVNRRPWLRRTVAATVLLGLFLILLFVYHKAAWMIVNTSDNASIVLEGWSLGRGNWNLSGWQLPADSFWTTDVLLYSLAVRVFGLQASVMKDVPALVFALVVACCVWLAVRPFRGRYVAIAAFGTFMLIGLPSIQTDLSLLRFVLIGPIHMGTMLFGLVSLALFDEVVRRRVADRRQSWRSAVFGAAAMILLALAIAGDVLAIVVFVVPVGIAAVVSLLRRGSLRDSIVSIFWVSGAVVVAEAALFAARVFGGFTTQALDSRFVSWSRLPDNLVLVVRGLFGLYGADFFGQPFSAIGTILILCHVGSLSFSLWALFVCARGYWRASSEQDWLEAVLVLACVVDLLAFVFSSVASDLSTTRYLMPIPILGSIIAGRRLARLTLSVTKQLWFIAAASLVVVALVLSFGLVFREAVPMRPQRELAGWLSSKGLHQGLGPFWDSSIITVESGGQVSVYPIIGQSGGLSAFPIHSLASWYDRGPVTVPEDSHLRDGAEVRFVVLRPATEWSPSFGVDEQSVIRAFGAPSDRFQVGTYQVLVWPGDLRGLLLHGSK